jgi:hypothetical protein
MAEGRSEAGGAVRSMTALAAVAGGLAYLANVGWSALEWIPDGAPLFGNLDEFGASLALAWGARTLFRRGRS